MKSDLRASNVGIALSEPRARLSKQGSCLPSPTKARQTRLITSGVVVSSQLTPIADDLQELAKQQKPKATQIREIAKRTRSIGSNQSKSG